MLTEANKTFQSSHAILNIIAKNKLQPGDKIPPEIEMSKMLGVSVITVQRALSILVDKNIIERSRGRGSFVKGDVFNNKYVGTIAFLLVSPLLPLYETTIFDARKAAEKRKHDLKLVVSSGSPNEEVVSNLSKINGMILSARIDQSWLDFVKSMNVPFVVLGAHKFDENVPIVKFDYESAVRILINKLYKRGCKRIGLINGARRYIPCNEIYNGMKKEMKKLKLKFTASDYVWCSVENRYQELQNFLDEQQAAFDALIIQEGCLGQVYKFFYEHEKYKHPILGLFEKDSINNISFSKYEGVEFQDSIGEKGVDALFEVMTSPERRKTYLIEPVE